jgi:hypothetical protein
MTDADATDDGPTSTTVLTVVVPAGTLTYVLARAPLTHIHCGNYLAANAQADELIALADRK